MRMLEIGGDFDDSIFCTTKEKAVAPANESYKAKYCASLWFDDVSDTDPNDLPSTYKYQADLAYYVADYHKALGCYDQCLGVLPASNVPVWKDVIEAKARCLMHMNNKQDALDLASQLLEQSPNYEQRTASLNLIADICQYFDDFQEEIEALQSLLVLHAINPDLWYRLAKIYTKLTVLDTSPGSRSQANGLGVNTDHASTECVALDINAYRNDGLTAYSRDTCMTHVLMALTCLQRARLLLCSIKNMISSFAKSRNSILQDQVENDLQAMDVPEVLDKQCYKFLYHLKLDEDENIVDDATKLEQLKAHSRSAFEQKWFVWHIKWQNEATGNS